MEQYTSESNVEKMNRIISSSNFKDLTHETLLQAYEEEGIRSLEDLAKRLTTAIQDPNGRSRGVNYDLFAEPTPRDILETIEHKVPEVPFRVNGVEYEPEDIVRFNGKELCFISANRSGTSELVVIENKSIWASFLQMNALASLASAEPKTLAEFGGRGVVSVKPTDPDRGGGAGFGGSVRPTGGPVIIVSPPPFGLFSSGSLPASVTMYNHISHEGYELRLEPRMEYFDLTSCYIFWPFDSWNDEISSIGGTLSRCVYFEHIHRWGSSLVLDNALGHDNLVHLGWNDRISSVVNFG